MKVRDAIRLIERDGWRQVATVGSHRQYKHPEKPGSSNRGRASRCGLAPENARKHTPAGGVEEAMSHKYAVIYERGPTSIGAYVPDLPGCVAAAESMREVQKLIREAIQMHLTGMVADGRRFRNQEHNASTWMRRCRRRKTAHFNQA